MTAGIPPNSNVISPQPGPQTEFLTNPADVIFYGGSAGGGKTYALLLDPLYHIDNPKFGSVIFRRTTKQITNEGALWDTAAELYTAIEGRMVQNPSLYTMFPSGMKVTYAHMEHEKNRYDWQGSQLPDLKFDELTHFTWNQFSYMLSRLRSASGVKGKIKCTLNPDPDHFARQWVDWYIGEDGFAIPERSGQIRWFLVQGDEVLWSSNKEELARLYPKQAPFIKSFTFIRSRLDDNRILMEMDPAYEANLHALPRVEKARLLEGNWDVRASAGSYFQRSEFEIVDHVPNMARRVRAWDLAATKDQGLTADQKERRSNDPDWTAGVLMAEHNGVFYIEHVERFREDPPKVKRKMKSIGEQDGRDVAVRFPQDPGQAGKAQAMDLASYFAGWPVSYYPPTGSKEHRATPFASQVQAGNVRILRGKWNEAYLRELENFPEGTHDDQVDASSDGFDELANEKVAGVW